MSFKLLLKIITAGILLFLPLLIHAQSNTQPLQVDEAFQLSIKSIEKNQVVLHWNIAKNYHLYQDRFRFTLENPNRAKLGQVQLPTGITKQDNILGEYQVYEHELDLTIPFTDVSNPTINLLVSYQGCSDANFCYPPTTKKINVNLANAKAGHVEHIFQDKITNLLKQGNYVWIFFAFMGFGLLLAFTPCVLPMIPILSGIIVGQNRKKLNTQKAFFLSLAYVLGMSLAYALAGILVAIAGSHLSEAFQAPWIIISFSVLFIILAFSLLGFFELRLPHFLQNPIINLSNKQKSGSYIGVVIMGMLSVLIVSPCVTAPLVGVLTFIAQTGDIILGSLALFALGLGMGIPLLIIGTTEGKFMPKSGAWMHVVKSAFGILLLGVAILLLQRILPGQIILFLWAALFIVVATYLITRKNIYAKGFGLLAFCYGVILLVGAAMGNENLLQPLSSSRTQAVSDGVPFVRIKTLSDLEDALANAKKNNQIVMIDFYADWCVSCLEMEKTTFSDPQVKSAVNNFVVLQVDVTKNDAMDRAIEDNFNVIAPPTVLFFGPNGQELSAYRVVGAMKPAEFLGNLQKMKKVAIGL